ncbi:hypothetical protein C9374_008685 [Naegleria lovaniensis]|uniref:Solute-binding protein family 3/N-terminal domain-containing protein n=1 Tax=Naegleria lovaniensis TaxID=51637 RepID=A0AA88GGF1_NAELO|nr:uncharacterized protein C9374_008685 [Naegleria lovaniensis]KAG2378063.1 hypothetical protein C9374_008685 [Naegleria lovaniensis]
MKTIHLLPLTIWAVLVLLLSHSTSLLLALDIVYENHTVPVTQDYTAAFDAAVQDMIVDRSFIDAFSNYMYFPVPACINDLVKYPKTNPFANRKALVMCMEMGVISPYLEVKHLVGNTIVQKINAYYGSNLQTQFKYLNTSLKGFFNTMKEGVDSGECDLIASNVTPTKERMEVAHFQCNYGMTSQAFLRTNKDGHLTLKTLQDLNQTHIFVGASKGTTYETLVKTQLSAAQYVPLDDGDVPYDAIKNNQVHAVIGDGVTYLIWVKQNQDLCKNCTVNFYNSPYGYGTFTTNRILPSSAMHLMQHASLWMTVLMMVMMTWILSSVQSV